MDGVYFRTSSERQTTENQFEDLLQVAEKDGSGRDWAAIRTKLSLCVREGAAAGQSNGLPCTAGSCHELARDCVYVEQGRSSKIEAGKRPLFEQMKRDAALRKFDRLSVWKVSPLSNRKQARLIL